MNTSAYDKLIIAHDYFFHLQ